MENKTILNIYTDGGCAGNQNDTNLGGWGAVLEFGPHRKELFGSEQALIRLLKARGITVAAAESLTGGMLSQKLTSVPGASAAVCAGCVTYSDEAKHKLLGVKIETLERYTAVSAETCREMAEGMRAISGADVAIAVTGYAGPQVSDEPVGLVYIGVAYAGNITVKECRFTGSRERIRTLTAVNAMDLTRRMLLKHAAPDASNEEQTI